MNSSETSPKKPDMDESWYQILQEEFTSPSMSQLREFLKKEISQHTIYPPMKDVFNAFKTPFDKIKVVILGQDPYHNPGQAHGLCFSVPHGIKPPPSLINIFKEIESDLGIPLKKNHANLTAWCEHGVFLLNTVLTVRKNQPGSHRDQGWEVFTDKAIHLLSERKEHLVFLLWGSFAFQKEYLINPYRHLILKAPHPSPFSANRGFFGCRHFSQANDYLKKHGQEPIDWAAIDKP